MFRVHTCNGSVLALVLTITHGPQNCLINTVPTYFIFVNSLISRRLTLFTSTFDEQVQLSFFSPTQNNHSSTTRKHQTRSRLCRPASPFTRTASPTRAESEPTRDGDDEIAALDKNDESR